MMEEESKAVQEVAKTTGKAIDAAREAGGFIARFIVGSLEQGMGIFEDRCVTCDGSARRVLCIVRKNFLRPQVWRIQHGLYH